MIPARLRLADAVAIHNAERNPRKWPALIRQLPMEFREPVSQWLKHTQRRKRGPKRERQHG